MHDLRADHGTGRISRVLDEVYHTDDGDEKDNITPDWCAIGPATDVERDGDLSERLTATSNDGISKSGQDTMEKILSKYRATGRITRNGAEPERIIAAQSKDQRGSDTRTGETKTVSSIEKRIYPKIL